MATKNPNEPFTRLTAAEAKDKIESSAAQVVDVRPPADYAGGHVPGALSLPHLSIRIRKDELAADKAVIFIDYDGSRSPPACELAATLGFSEIYIVEGGTAAWMRAGYELQVL